MDYNWKDKTILIAEDELMNYKLLEIIFRKTEVKLIWAKNGQEAVELFVQHQHEINIILMDIKMPIMNGQEATKKIKQLNKNINIVIQSAFAMPSEVEKSRLSGCNDFIAKPYSALNMIAIVAKYIS